MKNYRQLLVKARILLDEAYKDKDINCYNKWISALWFAIESMLKAIFLKIKGSYPTRIGSLINLLARELRSSKEGRLVLRYIREIYNNRKDVDHGFLIATKERCESNISKGEYVIMYLENIFKIKIRDND